MRFDDVSVRAFFGAKAPLLDAQRLFRQGHELLPVRAAQLAGTHSNATVTVAGVKMQRGRTVSITASARDASTGFPTSALITFAVGGVTIAARTYRPVNRMRFFSLTLSSGLLGGASFTIEGPEAVFSLSNFGSSSGTSNTLDGPFSYGLCPYTLTRGFGSFASVSGFAFGGSDTVIARRVDNGVVIDTDTVQVFGEVEPWPMVMVHAYTPAADVVTDVAVTFASTWTDPCVVVRQ